MKYRDITTRDDALYHKAAKAILGSDYAMVAGDASDAFQRAIRCESCAIKRANVGRRAANLVVLRAIQERGVTNWRQFLEQQKQNPAERYQKRAFEEPPKAGKTASGTAARKHGRKTILDYGE